MILLPIILGALFFVFLGALIGFAVAVMLGANIISVLLLAIFSALFFAGAMAQFKEGDKAGDGGMGDVIVGAMLLLVASGTWLGFCVHFYF